MQSNILELKNIVKTYGSTVALNKVNFELRSGEIHCLMGENGAGKSTLINIITGVISPDSGEIIYEGKNVRFLNAIESSKNGISAIYQHPALFPSLSVTENIFMGRELLTKFKTYDYKRMHQIASEMLKSLNCNVNVHKEISSLSVAQQQLVEIAKALICDAKLLILDEPTASLTKFECDNLYKILENLKAKGVSMIFITHRFEDMYRLADRVTVFRDATYINTWDIDKISEKELIKAMVGRELNNLYPKRKSNIGPTVLEVKNLSKTGLFKDISFDVKKGEVLFLTGLIGSGRTEVSESIFGISSFDDGTLLLDGKEIKIKKPKQALDFGIGLLSEDRQQTGLLLNLPIYQNTSAMSLNKFSKFGFLNVGNEISSANSLKERLRLKASSVIDPPSALSGGNQQKVVLAKLLSRDLKVLILDEPTKGVDVLAKYSIYEVINSLAEQGYAVIVISSEMNEVLGMADRIIVMHSGRITGEMLAKDATQEKIMEASISH